MKSLTLVLAALVVLTSVYGHHEPGHDPVPKTTDDLVSRIRTAMESAEIVPDVVGKAPSQLIKVSVEWTEYVTRVFRHLHKVLSLCK